MNEAAPHPEDEGDSLVARVVAVELLHGVLGQKQALDQVLESSRDFKSLTVRDRGFCRMLVSTCLRRSGQIEDILLKASDQPGRTSVKLTHILRLGITQILFMDVPDHAAVDTSVRLAELLDMGGQKGLVNGILRTVTRSGQEWLSRQDAPRLNTPEWLLKIWIEDYGLRVAAEIARANLIEAPLDITIRDESERNYWGSTFQASEIGIGSLRRPAGGRISELDGYNDGKWWVQDASAAMPARLFGDINGKHVIDLCAAPGGKTMQLAAQGATVTALDRSAARLTRLKENLARTGLEQHVNIVIEDAARWKPREAAQYVLLDAPCSATGTVRRNPDVMHLKSPQDVNRLRQVQEDILINAFDMLAPGGILIYCTCSLQKMEGEEQIEQLLRTHPNASKIAIAPHEVGDIGEIVSENGDLRILPFHCAPRGGMDGFYVSRITKR
jgi:16S rRNA (cytosine967-C5)-methyltransferase